MPRKKIKTTRYDTAALLKTDGDIIAYLEAALEDGDPRVIDAALGDIARARRLKRRQPPSKRERKRRLGELAHRSSYIENVLLHALIAELSAVLWRRDPTLALRVFNSEVDDSGFDLALSLGSKVRYIQLKQHHDGKTPRRCSIRLSFAQVPGSCVVMVSHGLADLRLKEFRFLGRIPNKPMADIGALRIARGRRDAAGQRRPRKNYREVPVSRFIRLRSAEQLLEKLFP